MSQILHFFAWDKALLVIGVLLQIISYFMPFIEERVVLLNEKIIPHKAHNKNFSFMGNNVIVRRTLLFLGVFFVSVVVLFESDYTLFIAQCLLFSFLYPKSE